MGINDKMFQQLAQVYPTERIVDSTVWAFLWRVFFYLSRPQVPFIMRTKYYQLWVDPRRGNHTRSVIRRGTWEKMQTRAVSTMIREGDVFIDVGANFGHYAMLASSCVGPGGVVIAFEAHPDAYARLKENAALQPNGNLVTNNAGVGNKAEVRTLISHAGNPGGHSFVAAQVCSPGAEIEVDVVSLDSYLRSSAGSVKPDFIKIDVEGFEWFVLQGATETIDVAMPIVFCEICPYALEAIEQDPKCLLSFFQEREYRPFLIFEIGRSVSFVNYDDLLLHIKRFPRIGNDIVFLPPQRFEEVSKRLEVLYPGLSTGQPVVTS